MLKKNLEEKGGFRCQESGKLGKKVPMSGLIVI